MSDKKPSALDAFLGAKERIDTMLAELRAASDEHYGADPEYVNWGHVGNLKEIEALLERALTFAMWRAQAPATKA